MLNHTKKCRWRTESSTCTSSKVIHIAGGAVQPETCEACPVADHEAPKQPMRGFGDLVERSLSFVGITKERVSAVVGDCGCEQRQAMLNDLMPFRPKQNCFQEFAVAVTTAPRESPTLQKCIRSIETAGVLPIVFAEPESDLSGISYRVILNKQKLGCWHNWLASARYLLEETDREILVTIQDDTILHPQSFQFLREFWPKNPIVQGNEKEIGCVSLYAPKHYQRRWHVMKNGKIARYEPTEKSARKHAKRMPGSTVEPYDFPNRLNRIVTKSLWGACAMAFRRDKLEAIVNHPIARRWKGAFGKLTAMQKQERIEDRKKNPHKIANSDTAIGKILNALDLQFFVPNPSLAAHIAQHSAIGHGDNKGRRNCLHCLHHGVSIENAFPSPGNMQISDLVISELAKRVSDGSTILEIGSGNGTLELAKRWKVHSIDHDRAWSQAVAGPNVKTQTLPIKDDWYSVPEKLPKKVAAVIVDGPPSWIADRGKLIDHIDQLPKSPIWIIDDTQRESEQRLSEQICKKLGLTSCTFEEQGTDRKFDLLERL